MKHRELRIAWSVVWGLVAVSLIMLWVRSRFQIESIERIVNAKPLYGMGTRQRIFNLPGRLELSAEDITSSSINYEPTFWHRVKWGMSEMNDGSWGFKRIWTSNHRMICFPHWFAVTLAGCVALLPWPPKRFSLRTMLIATTLVAIMLGIVMALV
jgi:hypothetical protein